MEFTIDEAIRRFQMESESDMRWAQSYIKLLRALREFVRLSDVPDAFLVLLYEILNIPQGQLPDETLARAELLTGINIPDDPITPPQLIDLCKTYLSWKSINTDTLPSGIAEVWTNFPAIARAALEYYSWSLSETNDEICSDKDFKELKKLIPRCELVSQYHKRTRK